jgi:hypothetical protein
MPACVPDFQSVLPNPSVVVVVAAAAPPAVPAAVNLFLLKFWNTPVQVSAGGIFLPLSFSSVFCPCSSAFCHLAFLTDNRSELIISSSYKSYFS